MCVSGLRAEGLTCAAEGGIYALSPLGATMSSVFPSVAYPGHDFSGNSAIDGVWGMGNTQWSFTVTNYERDPWLSIQVASGSFISSITIHGRSDCCQEFLGHYEVRWP